VHWIAHQDNLPDTRDSFLVLWVMRSDVFEFLPQANLVVLKRYVFELGQELGEGMERLQSREVVVGKGYRLGLIQQLVA
jgi:hypothetical protein